jgi:prepilin-type N-terminal cleavage/methylation domain-containing protein
MRRRVDGTEQTAAATRARRAGSRRTQDEGFSLVEMVVTITLMGLVMLPIMVAAYSLVRNSSFNRTATRVETVLTNAADRVNRATESCDYAIYVEAAVQAERWDESAVAASYAWYEPGATATTPGVWHTGAACPPSGYADGLVQRVDITVTSPDGRVTRSMQVVKSEI